MPLDPVIQSMIDKAAGLPPAHTLPLHEARAGYFSRYEGVPRPEVAYVEDRLIRGPRKDIRVRLYGPGKDDLARPVMVFFHGGGFVLGGIESHDALCRHLCLSSGAVVVAVDYSLAPENKFPAGLEDCLAAIRWAAENASSIGGDSSRLILAGDSAGGNLAAASSLRLREQGYPSIAAQILFYPTTDHYKAGMASYIERGSGFGLTNEMMRWFWDHYLNHPGEAADSEACPNRAQDLSSLPPTYVVTAEYDPLRDEGKVFAERLAAAGVDVTHIHYDDVNHGFVSWPGVISRADDAIAAACSWLKTKVG